MSTSPLLFPGVDSGIAGFEGYGIPGTYATINNNPGNIVYGPFAQSQGATGSYGGFAVFPDADTGFSATDALVGNYASQGYDMQSLINAWAPPSAGNPNNANYLDFVDSASGLSPTSPLSSYGFTPYGPAVPGSITSGANSTSLLGPSIGGLSGLLGNLGGLGMAFGSGQESLPSFLGNASGLLAGFSWGRVGTFLLGLICVAAGLLMFKPVSNTAISISKTGLKALAA